MLACFGEKAIQRCTNPANLAFDMERTQTRFKQSREAREQIGRNELDLAADDDEFHVAET